MVSFNCEACNDVVKKPKLDAHKSRCRNAVFTCIDCSTTFNGTDYRSHTSCISEDQKYQGALYRDPAAKGKKAKQQKPVVEKPAEEKPIEEKPADDTEMTKAPGPAEAAVEEPKKEKKGKKNKKAKTTEAPKEVEVEKKTTNGDTTADAPKEKKSKKGKKAKKEEAEATIKAVAEAPKEEASKAEEAEAMIEAVAEAPKEEEKGKEGKKDKKRKADDTTEAAAVDTSEAPSKKSKKEKKDTTTDNPKKPAASPAAAEAFLEQLKNSRPLTFQKALARVQKDLGEKFNAEELYSMLKLKREKDGITISVVGAKEGREAKEN